VPNPKRKSARKTPQGKLAIALQQELDIPYSTALTLVREAYAAGQLPAGRSTAIALLTEAYNTQSREGKRPKGRHSYTEIPPQQGTEERSADGEAGSNQEQEGNAESTATPARMTDVLCGHRPELAQSLQHGHLDAEKAAEAVDAAVKQTSPTPAQDEVLTVVSVFEPLFVAPDGN
jgi:hypothetical protein